LPLSFAAHCARSAMTEWSQMPRPLQAQRALRARARARARDNSRARPGAPEFGAARELGDEVATHVAAEEEQSGVPTPPLRTASVLGDPHRARR
jgi:hypothetical protein